MPIDDSAVDHSADHQALVRRLWHQIWIENDLDQLAEVVADPYVRHTRDGTVSTSPGDYARHIESAVHTIKGTSVDIHVLESVGDLVFARLELHGVNLTTGNAVKLTWLAQYRIVGGLIAESWTMHQSDLDW